MAARAKPEKRLAVDTNVLLDLAVGKDFATDFLRAFQSRGYFIFITPTVVPELAHLTKSAVPRKAGLALIALRSLRSWKIIPRVLRPVEHGITQRFALRLIARNVLAEGEVNDGQILAETALAEIPLLVTSDAHILDIRADDLILALDEADLPHVHAASPRRLIAAIRGKS